MDDPDAFRAQLLAELALRPDATTMDLVDALRPYVPTVYYAQVYNNLQVLTRRGRVASHSAGSAGGWTRTWSIADSLDVDQVEPDPGPPPWTCRSPHELIFWTGGVFCRRCTPSYYLEEGRDYVDLRPLDLDADGNRPRVRRPRKRERSG